MKNKQINTSDMEQTASDDEVHRRFVRLAGKRHRDEGQLKLNLKITIW